MPIFRLSHELIFPPSLLAEENGILAVGGDLSPSRLILAYQNGIFPWYNEGEPIIWHSPDPRFVLFPDELRISKSLRKTLNQNRFKITFDRSFEDVITGCSQPRKMVRGTWLLPEMIEAYSELHRLGFAHSVEAWQGDVLAGGLYGVALGRCFFGESMFSRESNASKAALVALTGQLKERGFLMIDSQVFTSHISAMGGREIPRDEYIRLLKKALLFETISGSWDERFTR
jgi:leucyl/phenylalanyl-tRNA--protein transferase